MNSSPAWRMTKTDWQKWGNNTVQFFVLLLAIFYLPYVMANLNIDGVQWGDFVPNHTLLSQATVYVVSVIYDFLRKLVPEHRDEA